MVFAFFMYLLLINIFYYITFYGKVCDFISKNAGKVFEDYWKESANKLENIWIYRLRDNAASFGNSSNTRFTSHNMCDYIMWDDNSRTFYCLELKSTKSTSLSLSCIRDNQIKELTEASKHNLIAGFIVNFRNKNNDTYFIEICDFNNMIKEIQKKSFNVKDLEEHNAIYIESKLKKVNYSYDVQNFVENTHL